MAAEWLQGECEYQAIHDEPFPKQTFGNQPKNGGKVVIVAVNADKGTVRKVNASRAAETLGVTKVVFRRWSRRISWKLLGMGALFG